MHNRWIRILIIINLILASIILLGKIQFIQNFTVKAVRALLVPVVFSAFLFYIIRPLNDVFLKKGISHGKAGLLTLSICTFILAGLISRFSEYAYRQFEQLTNQLLEVVNDKEQVNGYVKWINQFININELYTLAADMVKNYVLHIGQSFKKLAGYFMNTFSIVLLIIVIVFYMLKDGHMFKDRAVSLLPEKYKAISSELISDSDDILSHYVTGQAKVALSLAVMIYIGYRIIGIPNALLLSTITFVLAFIPFVGFFISLIIPVVIALSMGGQMLLKLAVVFIIVQTLKGRVVVPVIMAKTMEIHPLTDIFLVIGAIAVAGPFAAFAIVPVYAIVKNAVLVLKSRDKEA
jgi:predicted PurR-regulated permease PerM